MLIMLSACSSKSSPRLATTTSATASDADASNASNAFDAASTPPEATAAAPDADAVDEVDVAKAVDAAKAGGDHTSDASNAAADIAAATAIAEPTAVAAVADAREGFLSLRGFPGVSGDGMHIALVVGDRVAGPLAVRVTRIDGSVLLEKPLIEKGEAHDPATPADQERNATLRRRIGARATAAQRVLAKANMRSLLREPTPAEGGTTVVVSGDQLAVTLPGFVVGHYPRSLLDRGCATPTTLAALYSDREHGLVVASFAHEPSATCSANDEWQVFALDALP